MAADPAAIEVQRLREGIADIKRKAGDDAAKRVTMHAAPRVAGSLERLTAISRLCDELLRGTP